MKPRLQAIKDILLLPFNLLIIILKYFAYSINRDDFEKQKKKLESSYESNRILKDKIENALKQNKLIEDNRNRILNFLKRTTVYTREIFISNNEILIIYYCSENIFDIIYLLGENGIDPTNDSRINLSLNLSKKILKIDDFISNSANKGYGRFLMKYLIEKAKENKIEEIYGDLAPEDSPKFNWLIPFYESLGFTCTLFNDPKENMHGEIRLKL